MVNSKDVIRPNLSVREGIGNTLISHLSASFNYLLQEMRWGRRIGALAKSPKDTKIFYTFLFAEIVVSGGMSMPQILSTLEPSMILGDSSGPSRS
jgi:hypothetical protein